MRRVFSRTRTPRCELRQSGPAERLPAASCSDASAHIVSNPVGYTEWLLAEAREWLNSAPTLEELIEAQVAAANLELYIVDRPVARAARDNAAELATRFEREVDVRTSRATVLADASDPEFEQAITGLRATWRKPSPLAVEQKVRERRRYARAVDGDESVDAHAPMTNREVATSYARCANTANTAKPIISVAA